MLSESNYLKSRQRARKYVLILAGDHLYRMDYAAMADYHWEKNADITVAVQPVAKERSAAFRDSEARGGWTDLIVR